MPEKTNETIESSSTVLSCDNSSQDVENTNMNAKKSDKSKSSASPPPLTFHDSSVANSESSDTNSKRDNSCANHPLNSNQIAGTQEAIQCLMDNEKCLDVGEKDCLDLEASNCAKPVTNVGSSSASNAKTCFLKKDGTDLAIVISSSKPASQTASELTGLNTPSTELELMPISNYCASSSAITEESFPQASSTHSSRNITYQPSFSSLQDEYLHEICSRIGSNVDRDAYIPDIVTHNVSGNIDGKLCVIHPQTFQGADSTFNKSKSDTPHLSPYDKSAGSSTSSIATRPNTDNQSSMSKVTTRFGASRRNAFEGGRMADQTGAPEFEGYIQGMDNKSNLEMKNLSCSPHNVNTEVSRTKKDIITFKSTAV